MLPNVLHTNTILNTDKVIHHYWSTKGTGWCELIQVDQYQIWILYQRPSFENAPWEQDAKKRAVTKSGSYKYKYGLPHHPPYREEHGDRSATKYGFGKSKDATHCGWQETRTSVSDKAHGHGDQFKETQSVCWESCAGDKAMVNPRGAPVQEKDWGGKIFLGGHIHTWRGHWFFRRSPSFLETDQQTQRHTQTTNSNSSQS